MNIHEHIHIQLTVEQNKEKWQKAATWHSSQDLLCKNQTYKILIFFLFSIHLWILLMSQMKEKPTRNSHRSLLYIKLPYFPEIYLLSLSNAALSPLLHSLSPWHTPLSHMDSAFQRDIRTELNWITSPLPTLMTAINFANSADGKPIIWWLLCNWIVDCSTTECGVSNRGRKMQAY